MYHDDIPRPDISSFEDEENAHLEFPVTSHNTTRRRNMQ